MSGLLRWFVVIVVSLSFAAGAARVVAAEAADGHHAPAGDHEAPKSKSVPGMLPSDDLALFSLVTFVLMLAILAKFVWPQLQDGLKDRERQIRQNIADAEANRVKSESLVAEREAKLATVHDEIRGMLAEARRESEHVKSDILATAQKEAEATKQRAIAEIERSRDQALSELFDFVAGNVVGATERVIGRSLTDADHERLVAQAVSEMNVRRN